MSPSFRELTYNGLWKSNPALVQLLGLCPLLAVTTSVANAIGLGLATLLVLVGSSASVSIIRSQVPSAVRLPAFMMIIASFTTVAELLIQAFAYELYEVLGIFIPLIMTNCIVLGRADAFASKNALLPSMVDAFMMALGFTLVLITLGAMREILGQGVIFSDMQLIFGPMAEHWKITLVEDYPNFLFAILPPGAFIAMGLVVAAKNIIDARPKKPVQVELAEAGSKRVRVTGKIS